MTLKYFYNLLEEKLKSMNSTISLIKRTGQATSNLFWLGLWAFALGLLLWYPLRWWPGDSLWPVRFTNYFMPWLLFGLVPAFGLAIVAGRRRLAVALALPTLLITLTFAPLFLPQPSTALAGQESFKVMSYNIWGWNQEPAAMVRLIEREQPDILLLQEVTPRLARLLNSELADLYPDGQLHLAYEVDIGQAILSRYPLTPVEEGSYRKGRTQKVLADTPNGDIAVWNTHPIHPLPWRQQYRQISALVEDIAATTQPLIVGGDFNTTDQSETYQLINQYLHNAHWEAGWGFGFSFPSTDRPLRDKLPLPALVRIDHIFYSDHFFAHKARTLSEAGGSDHFPVAAELSRVN